MVEVDCSSSDMKIEDTITDAKMSAGINNNSQNVDDDDIEPKPSPDDDDKMEDGDEAGEKKKDDDDAAGPDDKEEEEKSPEEKAKEEEEEKKRIEELKKKYANWPLRDVKEPHENDVMYGRGGTSKYVWRSSGRVFAVRKPHVFYFDYLSRSLQEEPIIILATNGIAKWLKTENWNMSTANASTNLWWRLKLFDSGELSCLPEDF